MSEKHETYRIPTRLARLSYWLFPRRYEYPPEDLPGYAPGYFTVRTVCVFDFADRLRILVGGPLEVETKIHTDVPISKSHALSSACVLPPSHRPPRQPD